MLILCSRIGLQRILLTFAVVTLGAVILTVASSHLIRHAELVVPGVVMAAWVVITGVRVVQAQRGPDPTDTRLITFVAGLVVPVVLAVAALVARRRRIRTVDAHLPDRGVTSTGRWAAAVAVGVVLGIIAGLAIADRVL